MLSNFSTAYNVLSISLALDILAQGHDAQVTAADKSLCSSALFAGMIVGQLGGGALGDILGRHLAMTLVMLLQVLASLLSSFSTGIHLGFATLNVFHVLAFWRFVLGLGCGGVYPLAATLTAESSNDSSIESDAIALLNGRWIVDFVNNNNNKDDTLVLPYRQKLPRDAHYTLDQLKELTNIEIVVISHMWLHPQHPDPKGTTLRLLAEKLETIYATTARYSIQQFNHEPGIAVFFDWCSLYQHPDPINGIKRTDTEEQLFQDGLQIISRLFSHQFTRVWKVTEFPNDNYPIGYSLPTHGANTAKYYERGWPVFECCLAEMGKDSHTSENLSLQ